MKYAVEMGSGAMIYIPSFIKFGSSVRKLTGERGGFTDTETTQTPHKPTFIFLNKESRIKTPETSCILKTPKPVKLPNCLRNYHSVSQNF
jgi:hypothetical protein